MIGATLGSAVLGAGAGIYSSSKASDAAADASENAARMQAAAQQNALSYLKSVEKLPKQFREGALTKLGGLYGLEGGEGSQQELIDQARMSPLYQAIMGSREAGEEAILRHASATGGLRSGGVQEALYDYNSQLERNALSRAYEEQLRGLTGLSGLPSYAEDIAGLQTGIGETLAAGQLGRASAEQAHMGNVANIAMTGISQIPSIYKMWKDE